ncbi:Apc13 domain-containing protein [Microsporum canis CBS 113480]|uniref:Apc13 domain-containing protein n=1 Tax=Arthroderma otae (strain ATCC MYA-4605 / CBS 113480) TaxID=554155 RepID=C5FQU2_ARTOC|nr:Apc13 domain-containing protein [Microsporum canis CBS 113480]EEQ32245.1 Apc13 domain-containing protein [Microsporum canis CBS 113480]
MITVNKLLWVLWVILKSKDSSATHLHLHHPRLADVFEDFNRPHTSLFSSSAMRSSDIQQQQQLNAINDLSSPANIPSFLPIEDIFVQPQFQPVNPEDEDDVVPDQHAAFGITSVMDSRRQISWRDLGLEELMSGVRGGTAALPGSNARRRKRMVCLR